MIQASEKQNRIKQKADREEDTSGVRASQAPRNKGTSGIDIERVFSTEGVHPFDEIEWERRKASIMGDKGAEIFLQENVEVPKDWSVLATNICASKYFYGA